MSFSTPKIDVSEDFETDYKELQKYLKITEESIIKYINLGSKVNKENVKELEDNIKYSENLVSINIIFSFFK